MTLTSVRHATCLCLAVALSVFASSAEAEQAEITFHQDFDSGSLDVSRVTVEDASSDEPVITLPARRVPGRWYYFEVTGMEGKRPLFRVPMAGISTGYHNAGHRYVYSLDDGETYAYFGQRTHRDDDYYAYGPDEPFEQDTIRIAYAYPYPNFKTAAFTRRVGQSRLVRPTASADNNFVIGHTPGTEQGGYTDELGREIPRLALLGFRITDPDTPDDDKHDIVFISGNHASEHTAHFTLEGAVEFLVSDDSRARDLREQFVFHVYPQVNPEGRWASYHRSSPEHPDLDHNRDWSDAPSNTTIRLMTRAILSDTNGSAAMLIDFHSHGSAEFEIWDAAAGGEWPWFDALSSHVEKVRFHEANSRSERTRGWGNRVLNAPLSFTSETGFNAGWSKDDYRELGRAHVLALHDTRQDLIDLVSPPPIGSEGGQVEAASAHWAGPIRIDSHRGNYTGYGFANWLTDDVDASLSWTIDMEQGGEYELILRYALDDDNRPLRVFVNDELVVDPLDFERTGDWSRWAESVPIPTSLEEGRNTIRLEQIHTRGPHIDLLQIRPAGS